VYEKIDGIGRGGQIGENYAQIKRGEALGNGVEDLSDLKRGGKINIEYFENALIKHKIKKFKKQHVINTINMNDLNNNLFFIMLRN
jgi:hypothetical protein